MHTGALPKRRGTTIDSCVIPSGTGRTRLCVLNMRLCQRMVAQLLQLTKPTHGAGRKHGEPQTGILQTAFVSQFVDTGTKRQPTGARHPRSRSDRDLIAIGRVAQHCNTLATSSKLLAYDAAQRFPRLLCASQPMTDCATRDLKVLAKCARGGTARAAVPSVWDMHGAHRGSARSVRCALHWTPYSHAFIT